MGERILSERYNEARKVGVGRTLSAYVALRTAEINFENIDTSNSEHVIYRNAGLIEHVNPALIVVPGI